MLGSFYYLLYLIPQILAMIHFFRNRPESYWFWIILVFGPPGAVIYLFAVVLSGARGGGIEGQIRTGLIERRRMRLLQAKVEADEALPYERFELGELQFRFRKYDPAAKNLTESLRRAPENKDARYVLGLTLERLGRFVEAGRQFEPLVVEDPKYKFGEAMHALARCYRGAGEKKAAINAYKRVLAQSNFSEARFRLAELLIESGEVGEARAQLEKLIRDAQTSDLPAFQRRNEKRWSSRAKALLSTLPQNEKPPIR